ncbi:arogenate dehydrogenase [Candidatus Izimaplasma bacterium HR1]|jgi:prephenate dehydrogenase|nr:arogenate dehydrogenase [Candidatus Izimaplasma bacterium HR1]
MGDFMNIGIVGMGLIGGTYAKSLRKYPYKVYGIDIKEETITYALENNIVDYGTIDPKSVLKNLDVIFLCLYPKDTIKFIQKYIPCFKKDAIIADAVGVKRKLVDYFEMYKNDDVEFVYTHPIAGREKIGIEYSDEAIFHNANYVITPTKYNNAESLNLIETLARQMGFKNITRISDVEHDDIIAFTSQLTHAIAISLVNSDNGMYDTSLFIGDSYKDLTRIAMINENLWTELFLQNKDFLSKRIAAFEEKLDEFKEALDKNDSEKLKKIMIHSTQKRGEIK